MSTPSVTISATFNSGSIDLAWNIANPPVSNLKSIKSFVNENTATTQILETNHQIYELVNNASVVIQKITMGTSLLPLGKTVFVQLQFLYEDGTKILSNVLVLVNKQVPAVPALVLGTHVRSEDQGVSINIGALYTLNSVSDGYSPITKATVIISKVGGTAVGDLRVTDVSIGSYSGWYLVGAQGLVNAQEYEIAMTLSNAMGDSPLSNTLTFSPKDTPSQLTSVVAYSLLSDQKRKSQTLADANGSIVLYWNKPSDYDNLITQQRRVLKYIISEQEFVQDAQSQMVPSGNPTLIELVVPQHVVGAHSGATFELPLVSPEVITGVSHEYKYVISGSSQRLGKQFRYTVVANNVNGDGPISSQTGSVFAFKAADMQQFTLNHSFSVSNVTATPLNIYDGKMTMKIAASELAALNGGLGYSQNSTAYPWPITQGFVVPQDEKLRLEVINESYQSSVYNGLVLFKQKVTTSGSGQNLTYTATGEYNLDFDDISLNGDSLNTLLVFGTKYRFNLYRENKNPAIPADSFSSPVNAVLRTKFKSPNAVTKIQSYAINDDLTPVTSGSNPAVRLVFEQLVVSDLGGCEAFITTGQSQPDIKYYAYQNSLPVPGLEPISHDSIFSGTREFLIPVTIGNLVSQYVRNDVLNTELGIRIPGNESSPAVNERPFTYPSAVTSATITKVTATTITIGFTRQTTQFLGGSDSNTIQNRIVIFKDGDSSPAHSQVVAHNSTGTTFTSPSISLTNGASYVVFIVAERVYSKLAHNSTTNNPINRFSNVVVRANFYKENFVMTGQPTAPTSIVTLPSDKKLEVLYDSPSILNGVQESSLRYHFYMNSDHTDFPNFTTSPLVVQASVADVAGSSIALITKAFTTKAASNNRSNVVDLVNNTEYKFAMNVVGEVGGNALAQRNYSQTDSTGLVNGVNYNAVINLLADTSVPVSTVNGAMSTAVSVIVSDSVPSVQNLVVLGQENKLNIEIDKDTLGTVNDLQIILDNEDALGINDTIVPRFDTKSLRSLDSNGAMITGGLFNLETWASANPSQVPTLAPGFVQYEFKRLNVNGVFKYNLIIPNLVNGRTYSVSVRYIKNVNGSDVFGPAAIVSRAPEAPPIAIRNPKFSVDSQRINLSWDAPENSGGAGVGANSPLKYRVILLSSSDAQISSNDTSSTSYSIVSNLVNGTDYKVTVSALYTKASDSSDVIGPASQLNQATGNLIKPNPAPVGPTLAVTVANNTNEIRGTLVLPPSSETNLYPVSRYDVYLRHKSAPANKVLVQTFSSAGTTVQNLAGTTNSLSAGSTIQLGPYSNISAGVSPNTLGHLKPLNGFQYEVVVETIPNYTYAQAAPSKVLDATPYGPVIINSATLKTGNNNKVYTVVANLNGSGPITNIIGLGKPNGSNSILVNNLSGETLPSIATSGSLDNANNYVAANQIATFDLSFLASSTAVENVLAVVVTQLSSDTIVVPPTGFFS
jgi:hypothetical protein